MTPNRTLAVVLAALLVVGSGSAVLAATDPETHATSQTDAVGAQDETTTTEADGTTTVETETTEENETAPANITSARLTTNGSAIVVDQVAINTTKPPGGFVVVHLATNVTDGVPENVTQNMTGEVVGNSTYLEPGDHENVTVQLDQPIEADQTLIVAAYRDTRGDEQFDPEIDQPVVVDEDTLVAVAVSANASDGTSETGDNATTGDETTTEA